MPYLHSVRRAMLLRLLLPALLIQLWNYATARIEDVTHLRERFLQDLFCLVGAINSESLVGTHDDFLEDDDVVLVCLKDSFLICSIEAFH